MAAAEGSRSLGRAATPRAWQALQARGRPQWRSIERRRGHGADLVPYILLDVASQVSLRAVSGWQAGRDILLGVMRLVFKRIQHPSCNGKSALAYILVFLALLNPSAESRTIYLQPTVQIKFFIAVRTDLHIRLAPRLFRRTNPFNVVVERGVLLRPEERKWHALCRC